MRPLDCGPAGVRRLIRDLGDNLIQWRRFKEADSSPVIPVEEFSASAQSFDALLASEQKKMEGPSYGRLAISGEDLIRLGVKPGPAMGNLLKELQEIVIEDPTKNVRETLLALAQTRAAHAGSSQPRRGSRTP
jgi:tRNA nucleotidyltransferase (CCA-adding enzyme)